MTTAYEKRQQIDIAKRYEAGYQRGLKGAASTDMQGHTKPYLRGLHAGKLEHRKITRKEAKLAASNNQPKSRIMKKVSKPPPNKAEYLQILDAAIARATGEGTT